MVAFTVGVVAILVIMGLFASGAHDLPLALNLTAMLAPLGLGVALFGVYREARAASRAAAAATVDATGDAAPTTEAPGTATAAGSGRPARPGVDGPAR